MKILDGSYISEAVRLIFLCYHLPNKSTYFFLEVI